MKNFPLFMNLQNQRALVIGGGEASARKARLLLKAGANVRVIAGALMDDFRIWEADGTVTWAGTRFEARHLNGVRLVIAASSNDAVNRRVHLAARHRGIPVNVVDRPDLSTFIMPSIVDRGAITIAVSSAGTSPVLARRIRLQIEEMLPSRIGELAEMFGRWRNRVLEELPGLRDRLRFWERAIDSQASSELLAGHSVDEGTALNGLLDEAGNTSGEVWLVGAGPGDPDLLTLKALRLMQKADVVLYDFLVSDEIMDLVRRDADRIAVGKRCNRHTMPQSEIGELMIQLAREGKRVLRLKGGDPFIFGRGGEEMEDLHRAGIPCQVVPGITAASGCSSSVGLPLTHRDHARSVRFLTAHGRDGMLEHDWQALAAGDQTLVFYMGSRVIGDICERLASAGMAVATPVALIENGTRKDQTCIKGTIAAPPSPLSDGAPGLLVIGTVAALANDCHNIHYTYEAPNGLIDMQA